MGKGISKGAMWLLLGLLIVGLAGFGATSLSGPVRSVGTVGNAEIDVNTYARALQNEIRAREAETGQSLSFAEVQAAGIDRAVLSQLVSRAALEHEAARLGFSIGDENLRDEILDLSAFEGLDGSFDREAYRFALEQAGLSETEFEENIRAETASTLVQAAVLAGVRMPGSYLDTLMTYLAERRSLTFAMLDRQDLQSGLPVPSEADLTAYHEENAAAFTTPETKRLSYVWLTPSMIVDTVEVDEASLRAAYEAREAEFNAPERRLVERLVFSDRAAAERARTRIDEGIRLEMLVEERGLTMADVDLGDVTRADLGTAAEAVFEAGSGEVVGPVETDLGPALFRVNAVLAAQVTPFDEAKPQLRDLLAMDRARRVIETRAEEIDDLLAGGATLEEVARETDMELGRLDWHEGATGEIAGYDAFRTAAQQVTEADYPAVEILEDGGIFALRMDGTTPPRLRPLEEVRDSVLRGWRAQATVAALKTQVAPQLAALRDGTGFDELGLEAAEVKDMTRRDYQPEAPAEFIETVFGMNTGEVVTIEGEGRLFVLRLDAIRPPAEAEEDEDLARLRRSLQDQAASDFGQDLFQILADDIRARAGVEIDQAALNAVHANFN